MVNEVEQRPHPSAARVSMVTFGVNFSLRTTSGNKKITVFLVKKAFNVQILRTKKNNYCMNMISCNKSHVYIRRCKVQCVVCVKEEASGMFGAGSVLSILTMITISQVKTKTHFGFTAYHFLSPM